MRVNATIGVALFLIVLYSGCAGGPSDEGPPTTQIPTTAPPVTTPVIQTPTQPPTTLPPEVTTPPPPPAFKEGDCKNRCVEAFFFSGICREKCPEFFVAVEDDDECLPQELICCCYYDECDKYCGSGIEGVCSDSRKSGWKTVNNDETNQWCQKAYNLSTCYCRR